LIGRGRNQLGTLYRRSGRFTESKAAHEAARDTIEELLKREPRDAGYRQDLVEAYLGLANAATTMEQFNDAQQAYQSARQHVEQLMLDHPGVIRYRELSAIIAYNVGHLFEEQKDFAEAEKNLTASREQFERLRDLRPEQPNYGRQLGLIYTRLGEVIRQQDRAAEAITWYEHAQEALLAALANNPRDFDATFHLLTTHSGLGRGAAAIGNHRVAAREAEALVAAAEGHQLADVIFDAAIVLARASRAAMADNALADNSRVEFAEQYAARAVELLMKCRDAGLFKDEYGQQLFRDATDFEALKTRDDFSTLAAELKKK